MKRTLFIITLFALFCLTPQKVFASSANFSLTPSSATLVRGCTQQARVSINVASGTANAADIIVTYDTSKIEIIDAMPSIPGVQILVGDAFESYAGNLVNTSTGEIKLVGYSSSGTVTGEATFATILFKSQPLATNGGFSFVFTGANPYNSLDSNIADSTTSFDMLSGVSNASYTFVNGSCATDTTPPAITFVSPKPLSNNISPSAPLVIKLEDTGAGILLPTLKIVVNGVTYTSTSPEVSTTGTPNSTTVTLIPATPFPTNSVSVVTVIVQDAAGNQRTLSTSYNSAFTCPKTIITGSVICPTPTSKPSGEQGDSPIVTVNAETLRNLSSPWKIIVSMKDTDGISLDSFSATHGGKIYTFSGTPESLSYAGDKNAYEVTLLVDPKDITLTQDGKLIVTVRVTDLLGNTRIETVSIQTSFQPLITPTTTTVSQNDYIAELYTYTITPLVAGFILGYFVLFTMQPTVVYVRKADGKPLRFPRGYYIFKNGKSQRLFGAYSGAIHGRIPREAVMLVIQKYGYKPQSIPISPAVKYNPQKVVLTEL